MKMFLGEYRPNLIDQSRLALPAKLRDQLTSQEVVLTRGFEKCLFGYEKASWEAEAQKQVASPISDSKTRKLKRYWYSGAVGVALDRQGRFVIPPNLKSYAGIKSDITVIGAGDHFEVWDSGLWQRHLVDISKEVQEE
ncbi:MAG: division/cell wall cluster transcriptional repressor MraZ [bacterium]